MPLSSSCTSMLAIVKFDVKMYNFKSLPFKGDTKTGGLARYLLMSSKASWCSFSHRNSASSFNLIMTEVVSYSLEGKSPKWLLPYFYLLQFPFDGSWNPKIHLVVQIKLTFSSLSIFTLTASMILGTNLLGVCFTGFFPSQIANLCSTNSLLSSYISSYFYAKQSLDSCNKEIIFFLKPNI